MKKQTMKKQEFDFFEIDLERLDEEWMNQPKLYFEYAEKLTEAKELAARREAQLEVANDKRKATRAKLDLKIRKNPKKYFGVDTKPTETSITNRILVHSVYESAQAVVYAAKDKLIKANREVSTYYSVVFTLDHRKSALERLVTLHGQNYFSSPQATCADSRTTVDGMKKRAARRKNKKKKRTSK